MPAPRKYASERDLMAAMIRRGTTVEHHPQTGMVALYHQVFSYETFEDAAQMLFDVVHYAQQNFPGQPRHLYLDINEHRNPMGGFDHDMVELQQDFIIGNLAQWLTAVTMPLVDFVTPGQDDSVPPELLIH